MLNRIGFFQFENLVKNRIPFLFLNLTKEDLSLWHTSLYKTHLENNQKFVTFETITNDYLNANLSKDTAIVLMCTDGTNSLEIASEFGKNSYTNVYVIDGGYQQLMTERSSS
ncbi:MAG: rhodanese-like domain-containing protein [Pseudobdellovibrio sp.]